MKSDDIKICRQLAEQFVATNGGGNISDKIGDGGSAVVFLWNKHGQTLALKVYDPKFLALDAAQAERHRLELQRRLIGCHCESIVDTLAVDEELSTCFVTMEYFQGIELKKVIEKVPDEAITPLINQLVDAVKFLESYNLVHRDIKPENILVSLDFTQLKLLDLGIVREISNDEDRVDGTDHGDKRPFIATAQYSSPEYLFRLEPPSPAAWRALTIYQVGGVLHDLVCKKPLFEKAVAADNKYALAMAVMRESPDFTVASPSISHLAALAARCLTKDSLLRLQIVNWSHFSENVGSGKDKLKRALAARAANANHNELNEDQLLNLKQQRKDRINSLVDNLRNSLIQEFSPNLRVSQIGANESRACIFLKLTDVELGVKVALEYSWDSGIREQFAIVRLAAQASISQNPNEFSGERHAIGEIDVGGHSQNTLLIELIDAISNLLVKHTELAETGNISDEADLVAFTWPISANL